MRTPLLQNRIPSQARFATAASVCTAALLLVLTSGCAKKAPDAAASGKAGEAAAAAAPAPVDVLPAQSETVVQLVPVTGSIQALQSIDLVPKISEIVDTVNGREGDPVKAGEVLIQQDTGDLERQATQGRANILSAQAKLDQARTNYQVEVTNADAAIKDAQQQVDGALQELALTKQPQRTQEIIVAENNVKQAQANLDKAKSDRNRYDLLLKDGATAAITVDQYVNTQNVAQTNLDSAKQQLDIAKQGGRVESIQQQQTQVERARQALRQAIANRGQVAVRKNDIEAAQAAVAQAQAALGVDEKAIRDASLRSPIDGVISARKIEPGQLATGSLLGGSSLMTIISLKTVFFEAQINEGDTSSVHPGQPVQVTIDSYPGRIFTGKVVSLYPTGSTLGRTFNARIEIPNQGGTLRPGLFARAQIVVGSHPASTTVPVEAILRSTDSDNTAHVFVVEDGVAHQKDVQLGLQTPDSRRYEVTGLSVGDQVVVAGQRTLSDGDHVKAEQSPDTHAEAAKYESQTSQPVPDDPTPAPGANGATGR